MGGVQARQVPDLVHGGCQLRRLDRTPGLQRDRSQHPHDARWTGLLLLRLQPPRRYQAKHRLRLVMLHGNAAAGRCRLRRSCLFSGRRDALREPLHALDGRLVTLWPGDPGKSDDRLPGKRAGEAHARAYQPRGIRHPDPHSRMAGGADRGQDQRRGRDAPDGESALDGVASCLAEWRRARLPPPHEALDIPASTAPSDASRRASRPRLARIQGSECRVVAGHGSHASGECADPCPRRTFALSPGRELERRGPTVRHFRSRATLLRLP